MGIGRNIRSIRNRVVDTKHRVSNPGEQNDDQRTYPNRVPPRRCPRAAQVVNVEIRNKLEQNTSDPT